MSTHAVIVAQSGSGKSTFLGRLIEELLIRTKAECVVFDPNADFWRSNVVENATLWQQASYNPATRLGKLPHEASQRRFARAWSRVGVRIRTARGVGTQAKPYERLHVWLPSLSIEAFTEGLDAVATNEIYQCHAFVQAVAELQPLTNIQRREDLIDRAEGLFEKGKQNPDELRALIQKQFQPLRGFSLWPFGDLLAPRLRAAVLGSLIDRALAALPYVSPQTGRFYFGRARHYKASGILATSKPDTDRPERLTVIDLPSLGDREVRSLMVNALLAEVWSAARNRWEIALQRPSNDDDRVPTFIVIEEAHNLIPADALDQRERTLRDQIRMISAEGRKYGLFLILVSQRPDKLDPLVVSECENKAIMRLDSEQVLVVARRLLGLEAIAPRTLDRCLDFELGRAMLIGRWASGGARVLYTAARRTVEGGRNLRPDYWARPIPLKTEGRQDGARRVKTS